MDVLLAKVEPISGDGSASGIADLRRGKEVTAQEQFQTGYRGVKICEQHNSAARSVEKEGRRRLLCSW